MGEIESRETYSMEAHCSNCREVWAVYIPKKVPVMIYEKQIVCERCGCGDISIRRELRFG